MCGAFLRRSLVFIECNVKMATHQMIESDSPSRNKKAKIESFEDSKMSIMRDIHVKLHMNHSNNIVFKEFGEYFMIFAFLTFCAFGSMPRHTHQYTHNALTGTTNAFAGRTANTLSHCLLLTQNIGCKPF